MKRRAFTIFPVVSLLLIVLVVVLWARGEPLSFVVGGDRYSLRADGWSLRLTGPPADQSPQNRETADRWATELTNDRMDYDVNATLSERGFVGWAMPVPTRDKAFWSFVKGDRGTVTRRFLRALDDPHRFAAAHVVLRHMHVPSYYETTTQDGERLLTRYHGLDAELWPRFPAEQLPEEGRRWERVRRVHLTKDTALRPPSVRIDTAQLPRIRRQWHDMLDRRLAAIPLWIVLASAAVAPAVWIYGWGRSIARRRRRSCVRCGYDLRATPDRCPECGAVPHDTGTRP